MATYDYGCLMLGFNIPEIKKIQEKIDEKDLYLGDKSENDLESYGFEEEHHVTLLYGLLPNVEWKDLKKYLLPLDKYLCIMPSLSIFENDKYDVLKLTVISPEMHITNKKLRENVEYHETYPEYQPHMTIAYLKPGKGKKYAKPLLDKIIEATPRTYDFSKANGERHVYNKL